MIKSNELRIGNYILKSLKSGQGRKIESKTGCQDIVRIFENTGSFNYEPIPLTEEWLLRFGFIENKLRIGVYDLVIVFPNSAFYNGVGFPCQYVHQLQNLFYALTETELTLKS